MSNFGKTKPHFGSKRTPSSNHPYHRGADGKTRSKNTAPTSKFPFTKARAKF